MRQSRVPGLGVLSAEYLSAGLPDDMATMLLVAFRGVLPTQLSDILRILSTREYA